LNAVHRHDRRDVTVWDADEYHRVAACPGVYTGLSRDGQTLLTYLGGADDRAWRVADGAAVSVGDLSPDDFDRSQRTVIRMSQSLTTLELRDVFGQLRAETVSLGRPDGSADTWMMTPDGRGLVVTASGETAGHDWAEGRCLALVAGAASFAFPVYRFQSSPPINIPAHAPLLVMGHRQAAFNVYHLTTGAKLREVPLAYFGMVADLHPQRPWLLAAGLNRPGRVDEPAIVLVDVEPYLPTWKQPEAPTPLLRIPETSAVDALRFHPDGRRLASGTRHHGVHVWDAETGELLAHLKED
jgi:hypothetical protein